MFRVSYTAADSGDCGAYHPLLRTASMLPSLRSASRPCHVPQSELWGAASGNCPDPISYSDLMSSMQQRNLLDTAVAAAAALKCTEKRCRRIATKHRDASSNSSSQLCGAY